MHAGGWGGNRQRQRRGICLTSFLVQCVPSCPVEGPSSPLGPATGWNRAWLSARDLVMESSSNVRPGYTEQI